jgi:hypothetical protein
MQQLIVRDVTQERLQRTVQGLKDAGATNVDPKRQADGKYTVTATFPD